MKRLAIISLALTTQLLADIPETEFASTASSTQGLHRIQVGPQVFWQHYSTSGTAIFHGKKFNYDYKVNSAFIGPRIEYEYSLPNAYQINLEGEYADSTSTQTVIYDQKELNYHETLKIRSRTSLFGNLEGRIGSARKRGPILLGTYVGLGWNYLKIDAEIDQSVDWYYALSGIQMSHKFSEYFDLGMFANMTYALYMHGHHIKIQNKDDGFWGYEVRFPMTFHAGESKPISIKLEPYYQMLNIHQHLFNLGSRLELSCKF
jgi:hypothetical protein